MTRNISRRKFAGNFDFLLDKSIDVQKEKEKIEVADHSNNIPGLYSTWYSQQSAVRDNIIVSFISF